MKVIKIKKQERIRIVGRVVLETIKVAGLLAVAAVAPDVIVALKKLGMIEKRHQKYYINKSLERLKAKGLIVFQRNSQGMMCSTLTEKGKKLISLYEFEKIEIVKPKRWDRKYHVVIFDIKEWKRNIRDHIRSQLQRLGFLKLQNSVWIYPYYCEDLINLIKTNSKIGKEVLYLTVDSVENDKWIRKYFGLPLDY